MRPNFRHPLLTTFSLLCLLILQTPVWAEQPLTIFHAFNMKLTTARTMLPELNKAGYDAIQLSPLQQSPAGPQWYLRYQPLNYAVLEGLGNVTDLSNLTIRARQSHMQVIADVVFNHGFVVTDANTWENARNACAQNQDCAALDTLFQQELAGMPEFSREDFHPWCRISDWDDRDISRRCWGNGEWADFRAENDSTGLATGHVMQVHEHHLDLLLQHGVTGFRFDAVKHMTPGVYAAYIAYVNQQSGNHAWNYAEVLADNTDWSNGRINVYEYTPISASTDFKLLKTLIEAFSFSGDLKALRDPNAAGLALNDPRSVVFARNHDTVKDDFNWNDFRDVDPSDPGKLSRDGELAWAYLLARKQGTPLVFSDYDRYTDCLVQHQCTSGNATQTCETQCAPYSDDRSPIVRAGVAFRKQMQDRQAPAEFVLNGNYSQYGDSNFFMTLTRGAKGFVMINKAGQAVMDPDADFTGTPLLGCYRNVRDGYTVKFEKQDGHTRITRWQTASQQGIRMPARDALFFMKVSALQCLMP